MGLLAVHAGEEHLVIGDAVLGKVKAFGLIRQLIDGKLSLLKHLLPRNAQKLEKMLAKGRFGLGQQGRHFEGFSYLGDIHFRAQFSLEIGGFGEGDQEHTVVDRGIRKRLRHLQLADGSPRQRVEIDMFRQRHRKPVGEILFGFVAQPLLGAKLRAPPVITPPCG